MKCGVLKRYTFHERISQYNILAFVRRIHRYRNGVADNSLQIAVSAQKPTLSDHSLASFCGSTPITIDSPSRLSPTGNVCKESGATVKLLTSLTCSFKTNRESTKFTLGKALNCSTTSLGIPRSGSE